MALELDLKDEQLEQLMALALYQTLGEDARENLIQASIAQLLKDSRSKDQRGYSRYGSPVSNLQKAFNEATNVVAQDIAEKTIREDENVMENIRSIISEAVEKVLVENRDNIVIQLSKKLTDFFSPQGY